MNISQIRYFLAVVETGSFTKAAERANVSQPTLSAGIKRLEEDLGAVLLDRGGRGALLTPAGARFLPRARVLMSEWTAARRELRLPKPARQRLRLGHMLGLPPRGLSGLLGGFMAAHPDVAIETLEAPAPTLRRRLELGRIDAALTLLDGGQGDQQSLALLRQRYRLALPLQHPLAHRASVKLNELHDQAFVIRPQAEVMPASEKLFNSNGVRPRIVGRAESDAALLALVEAGLGLAVLPSWLLDGARERVANLPLAELRVSHSIGLAWRGEASATLQLLLNYAEGYSWDKPGPVIGH
ncbi:LysR family transcriptional regulator [Ferrovibrio sp.]|uniref:LysR family transcriptional regulator n=1 Tax=Ferrovibrio sp. TaxID=1917215 RepID=UPI0035B4087E